MSLMELALSTGRICEVIKSRRKSPGLERGTHWILRLVTEEPPPTERDLEALLSEALRLAMQGAKEPGRFRLALNGPAQRRGQRDTRAQTHVHIMLPEGNDELPRLVRPELDD